MSPSLGYTSTFTAFHRALILLACILPGSPLAQRYEDRIEDKANLLDCGKCLASNPSSTTFPSSSEAQSGRRLLGTNGGSLWLWCCLAQPGV